MSDAIIENVNRSDEIFEAMMDLGHEIAALEGAGDTGYGCGVYEVFITRGAVEYQVTVAPYWDNERNEPASEDVIAEMAREALAAKIGKPKDVLPILNGEWNHTPAFKALYGEIWLAERGRREKGKLGTN
jgi:hypothetical protein